MKPLTHGALSDWDGSVSAPTVAAPGPWKIALVTSVLSATTGWALDEAANALWRRKKR